MLVVDIGKEHRDVDFIKMLLKYRRRHTYIVMYITYNTYLVSFALVGGGWQSRHIY